MQQFDYIVAGAGSAGRKAVETLAEEESFASILLINQEQALPYKRTKISKYLASGFAFDDFALHNESWYSEKGIQLLSGATAGQLDSSRRHIVINGEKFAYGKLLLAMGAKPALPGFHMPATGWSQLWTEEDGRILQKAMMKHQRFIVIGMGVLGIETAWQLVSKGKDVVLIGKNQRPMLRYLDKSTAALLTESLQNAGVELHPGCCAQGISADALGKMRVDTECGQLSGDFVVIATGTRPETRLAETAGIATGNGILVDSCLRTSHESVWAAGDCAEHPGGIITGLWHSAEDQGCLAALSMMGMPVHNDNPPFRLKCEVFGGFWFSAGPVNASHDAEIRDDGTNLWRAAFINNRLESLSGCARSGLTKAQAKQAQALILEKAPPEKVWAQLFGGE